MRQAMMEATVGDDVYGEDPTVNLLEERGAALLGQEAALFCATGSMANLLGVWLDVGVGGEILCDQKAHIVRAELGSHAALHGITSRTWATGDGVARLEQIEPLISLGDDHLVSTEAIELENTLNFASGAVQPLEQVRQIAQYCREHGLRLHLDGARLGNACVATGVSLADYGRLATTVTLCLSKGLGAPVGSLLASSRENIERARVERKRLGGGWRQAGMLAAAGLYALDHNIQRLADDNRAAAALADEVRRLAPWAVAATTATNIVVVDTGRALATDVAAQASRHGVRLSCVSAHEVRAVTHLDVTYDECREAGAVIGAIVAKQERR
jgi:threonine aldolase